MDRCKESKHRHVIIGVWRTLEVPDRTLIAWSGCRYGKNIPKKIFTKYQTLRRSIKGAKKTVILNVINRVWSILEVNDWSLMASYLYRQNQHVPEDLCIRNRCFVYYPPCNECSGFTYFSYWCSVYKLIAIGTPFLTLSIMCPFYVTINRGFRCNNINMNIIPK